MRKINFTIIDGPMGAGKTTAARILHRQLKRTILLSRDAIKFWLSDYRRTNSDNLIVVNVLLSIIEAHLRQGINILFVESFRQKEIIQRFLRLARKYKASIHVYRLTAPREVLLERLQNRPKAVAAKTPVPKTRILKNLRLYEKNKYEQAIVINTAGLTPEEVVEKIKNDLRQKTK